MWERFRKKENRGGRPAPELASSINAIALMSVGSLIFLGVEQWIGRILPYDFLYTALVCEGAALLLFWSAFRLGRIRRITLQKAGLWICAAISLPISVYLTLVDAGGEIRFVMLLFWFLAYGRITGIWMTVLYLLGETLLLILSGKFDFFAGNDPIRSLVRSHLLALSVLLFSLWRMDRPTIRMMPARTMHLLLQWGRRLETLESARPIPGQRLMAPTSSKELWAWLSRGHRSRWHRSVGPTTGTYRGRAAVFTLHGLDRLAHSKDPVQSAMAAQQRLADFRERLRRAAIQAELWMQTDGQTFWVWTEKNDATSLLQVCQSILDALMAERTLARSRGLEFPDLSLFLYSGDLLVLESAAPASYEMAMPGRSPHELLSAFRHQDEFPQIAAYCPDRTPGPVLLPQDHEWTEKAKKLLD
ncbi:MAG: hypothetical protein KDK33_01490 [Leptospiraceae bacterium]|nr:hypothetical protein [Leptospiraceae bacterium]